MKVLVFLLAIVMVFFVMTSIHANEDHSQSISRLLDLLIHRHHRIRLDTNQGQHERRCNSTNLSSIEHTHSLSSFFVDIRRKIVGISDNPL